MTQREKKGGGGGGGGGQGVGGGPVCQRGELGRDEGFSWSVTQTAAVVGGAKDKLVMALASVLVALV